MFQAKFHAVDPPAYSQRYQVGRQSASPAAMSELFILQAISLPVLWQTVPPEVGHEEAHLHSHRYGHYLFYFLPACRYYLIYPHPVWVVFNFERRIQYLCPRLQSPGSRVRVLFILEYLLPDTECAVEVAVCVDVGKIINVSERFGPNMCPAGLGTTQILTANIFIK